MTNDSFIFFTNVIVDPKRLDHSEMNIILKFINIYLRNQRTSYCPFWTNSFFINISTLLIISIVQILYSYNFYIVTQQKLTYFKTLVNWIMEKIFELTQNKTNTPRVLIFESKSLINRMIWNSVKCYTQILKNKDLLLQAIVIIN